MTTISAEERIAMRDSFARLLEQRADEEALRKAIDTDAGYDPALWQEMADMGILSLLVDPEYGGIGGDAILLEMLMEEAGSRLLCSPFISTAVVASSLTGASTNDDMKSQILSKIVAGQLTIAIAMTGEKGLWTTAGVDVTARQNGDSWQLDGNASFVMHAETAGRILVIANVDNEIRAFLVAPDAPGVALSTLKTNDPTLRLSQITLSGAVGQLLEGVNGVAVDHAMNLARIALAGEQAGGVKRIFDITIDYLQTRYQFGRQIGSYQAMKHMAADMLVEVESATSAARHAAEAFAKGSDEAQTLVNLAGFACADAYRDVTAQAIQMHGGIAYTWEHPAHLYWRRARTGLWLFGSSDHHRDQYLTQLEAA